MTDELIYLSVGTGKHVAENVFSIDTALRFWTPDCGWQLVLYTDTPALLESHPGVIERIVTADQMRAWAGPHDYVYLASPAVIADAFSRGAERVMLIDGDTYWTRDPATLFARLRSGVVLVHEIEGVRVDRGHVLGMHAAGVAARTKFLNAGLIGLHVSAREAATRAIERTNRMLDSGYGEHSHDAEMLAFSLELPTHGEIGEAEPWLTHYWPGNIRAPFDRLLEREITGTRQQRWTPLWSHRPRFSRRRRVARRVRRTLARVGIVWRGELNG